MWTASIIRIVLLGIAQPEALAMEARPAFGVGTMGGVSGSWARSAVSGGFDLARREFGLDTTVDANNSLTDCDGGGVVQCTQGFGDSCCAFGGECCGAGGCCEEGFKCGIDPIGACCREDQDVCGDSGCYSEADGDSCCGGFEVCHAGEECCGLTCCTGDQICAEGLCKDISDFNGDDSDGNDNCCEIGGPLAAMCPQDCTATSGAIGGLQRMVMGMAVSVGGIVAWDLCI